MSTSRVVMMRRARRLLLATMLTSVTTAVAGAQLPNASAAAFGMAGNFTALARGYEAVAWNPANLAMPGRPGLSIGLAMFGGTAGMDPIDISALHGFSGRVVDSTTRVAWIDQVRLAGKQRTRVDGGITPFAFSLGPVAFQAGTSVYSNLDLSPDAFEAWMFGNAGNNGGQPKDLDFTGTSVRVGAITTGAMSLALPIPINLTRGFIKDERAAVAITGKYIHGSALTIAQDDGSSFVGTDIQVRFPHILPDSTFDVAGLGTGVGADVSLAWAGGRWKVGLLAANVFNTFKWDTTKLAFSPGTSSFDTEGSSEDFDAQPYGAAPQVLRDIVAAQQLKPAFAIGAALDVLSSLTLTADVKRHLGGEETLVFGPRSHVGIGAEWRAIPFIPLRAGVASLTDGWQAGAGVGLSFLGYELGVSTSIRRRGQASESGLMVGLFGVGR